MNIGLNLEIRTEFSGEKHRKVVIWKTKKKMEK